jgi:hypothetical protein
MYVSLDNIQLGWRLLCSIMEVNVGKYKKTGSTLYGQVMFGELSTKSVYKL